MAVFLINISMCFSLELLQQAASDSKSKGADVAYDLGFNTARKSRIEQVISEFNEFSAARQLFSAFFILSTKTVLSLLILEIVNFWHFPGSISSVILNDYFLIAVSAIFISFYLQLLPKSLARLQPFHLLSGRVGFIAEILTKLGRIGLDYPRMSAEKFLKRIGVVNGREQKYGPSKLAMVESLAERLGFYVEHSSIKIRISPYEVSIFEISSYRLIKSQSIEEIQEPNFVHRFTVSGIWELLWCDSDVDHTDRLSEVSHRTEQVTDKPFSNHQPPDRFDPNTPHAQYDREIQSTNISTRVNFSKRQFDTYTKLENMKIWSELISVDNFERETLEINDYCIEFGILAPTKALTVEIENGKNPAEVSKLSIKQLNSYGMTVNTQMEKSASDAAQSDASTKLHYPIFGNTIAVKFRV
ncbi:hypothetical protein E2K80_18810 [Rhodophyticola sp. CCM32]|uniref:hypothetical protein n=1 Tax=Rhodophyticola sp. CCM32 TaxID=2916397 RepID=UPI00107F64DB|nr:hypothetical protein [Rhodophyticola sp. CCM32]QBY02536.1 hypothetical protein E2K80_18810 [Rhodophyticola sp. CCM32]